MFGRYEVGEQAVLVHVNFSDEGEREDLEELKMLVSSAGVNALRVITTSRSAPSAKHFVGSGKAEEIAYQVQMLDADVVIFNHALLSARERNLERLFQCRLVDRTGLILDIFAQRARTHEGKTAWSNWPSCVIFLPVWFEARPTLNVKKAGSACVARVKPSLKPTDACCASASRRFCAG